MSLSRIIVSDTETTGVDPAEDARLLEMSTVVVERGPSGRWTVSEAEGTWASWMVEHTGPIPPEARAVHHISPEQVAPGAPNCHGREAVMHSVLSAYEPGSDAFAFHNREFDLQFLPELAELPVICTYRCARHIWPNAPGHGNQVLRYWTGSEPPAAMLVDEDGLPLAPHRALYDTACTAAVLVRMLEGRTAEELLELTRRPILIDTIRFGKHKGTRFGELPRDYLSWLRTKSEFYQKDSDLRYTVDHYLRR